MNRKPEFFTINGQSGFFAAHNPYITPHHRVGEPVVIRILNAGLSMHSLHFHANHYYVTGVNGVVQENVILVTLLLQTLSTLLNGRFPILDRLMFRMSEELGFQISLLCQFRIVPFLDLSLILFGHQLEELDMHFPKIGTKAGNIDISVRLSPICYPMHDHTEPSQSAQGGNYGLGMMSGIHFIGDRNTPGKVTHLPW